MNAPGFSVIPIARFVAPYAPGPGPYRYLTPARILSGNFTPRFICPFLLQILYDPGPGGMTFSKMKGRLFRGDSTAPLVAKVEGNWY